MIPMAHFLVLHHNPLRRSTVSTRIRFARKISPDDNVVDVAIAQDSDHPVENLIHLSGDMELSLNDAHRNDHIAVNFVPPAERRLIAVFFSHGELPVRGNQVQASVSGLAGARVEDVVNVVHGTLLGNYASILRSIIDREADAVVVVALGHRVRGRWVTVLALFHYT